MTADPETLAVETMIDCSKRTLERALELARIVRVLNKHIRELEEELKAQLYQQMGAEIVDEALAILQGEKQDSR